MPENLVYRAMSPCYVNETYEIMHDDAGIWMVGKHGDVIMSAAQET